MLRKQWNLGACPHFAGNSNILYINKLCQVENKSSPSSRFFRAEVFAIEPGIITINSSDVSAWHCRLPLSLGDIADDIPFPSSPTPRGP